MNFDKIHTVYLIGIGGIGMSALARYFMMLNKKTMGYDLTETNLTKQLVDEGIRVFYNDNPDEIPIEAQNRNNSLVIYTPAIPKNNKLLTYFSNNGFKLLKRAEVLGYIANKSNTIAVAGTHGKTSISGLLSHILSSTGEKCTAFVGGIMNNYNSNFLFSGQAKFTIVEADEFDKSFLQLKPANAIISSIDADHLDIYNKLENLQKGFLEFANQIKPNGNLLIKKGLNISPEEVNKIRLYTYSADEEADIFASNIHIKNNQTYFDINMPGGKILKDLFIQLPGRINIENTVAASGMAYLLGVDEKDIRSGLSSFKGIKRRFDFLLKSERLIYMDDYAHHPKEISAMISSIREVYPDRKLTGVFQPHLFSRTKDFANEFAISLSMLDEVILLDIYPAREKPVEGISAKLIFDNINIENKIMCNLIKLIEEIEKREVDFLITIGAGNIDTLRNKIKSTLEKRL